MMKLVLLLIRMIGVQSVKALHFWIKFAIIINNQNIMQREQTDSRVSSVPNKKSIKKLTRIKLHVKTEKTNLSNKQSQYRKSQDTQHPKRLSPLNYSKKGIGSLSSITQEKALKWRLGKTQDANISPRELPQINDIRALSGWATRNSFKRSEASNSMKIPFKELIPVKQRSKQDRLENFRRIRDQFKEVVNTSNFISVKNKESFFRAYVQKGNNGVLVKQLLKKRWWWHLEDQPTRANLMWTQWFNKGFISQILQEKTRFIDCHDYSPPVATQQAKVDSIRKILDQITFTRIKPRISLKQEHYLRVKKHLQMQGSEIKQVETPNTNTIHNHVDGCLQLHSKKLLFKNLYDYLQRKEIDPFLYIPVTYYIDSDDCQALQKLYQHCNSLVDQPNCMNLWIVKPGQNSNRGFGISVHAGLESLKSQIQKRSKEGKCCLIVQKYIESCFLVENRKFDIRCYILLTTVNGILKGYWYADGYIRTSSQQYNINDVQNRMIHLTNDAVQKHNESYGKFQDYNKMSFTSFRKYIFKKGFPSSAFDKSYQIMKNIAFYLIAAVSHKIRRRQYSFQLFGLDYMLDSNLTPILIEANSNPCLETSGVILGKLIPQLVDNVLMTAVDPLFPPPDKGRAKDYLSKDYFRSNKFQLIFNQSSTA